jgi:signal transduction histidine kinase
MDASRSLPSASGTARPVGIEVPTFGDKCEPAGARSRFRMNGASAGTGKRLTRVQLAALVFLGWTAVGVFQAVPEALKYFEWAGLIAKVVDAWAWALLTPVILLIDRKLASKEQNLARVFLLFLLLSIPFSLVHTYLSGALLYPFPEIWWNPLRNMSFMHYYFVGGWFTYCTMIGVLQSFRFYGRFLNGQIQLERVEKSLLESRLNVLRLHLEPHFIFNALNSIASEVSTRHDLARNMIGNLGELLRVSLECKDSVEIPLSQELRILDHYVSIQTMRFGDRMEISVDAEPDTLQVMVPPMLLQPLVENAIRHGIDGRMSGGRIVVSASKAGDRLTVRVVDNGVGVPRNWRMEASAGYGLRLTLERLTALYPGSGEECLTIRPFEGGGTEVVICIPLNAGGRNGAIV